MPTGENVTAFHFPKEQQNRAYEAYESEFLERGAAEEKQLRFKACIARRIGLRNPLSKA